METIILRVDLRRALEEEIEKRSQNINDIVNEAVELYLRERQRAKLDREIAAYETMHTELKRQYFEQ